MIKPKKWMKVVGNYNLPFHEHLCINYSFELIYHAIYFKEQINITYFHYINFSSNANYYCI